MKLNEAIEVLKDLKRLSTIPMTLREGIDTIFLNKAIDTVVEWAEKPLPTDEQIEQYALKNILDGVGIQSMINMKAWIAGATWMRNLIQERRAK